MRNKIIKSASLAILLALASAGTSAALIDQGTTTLDNVSMFEWLDLTETQGLTVNQFLAGDGGWISAGWNYANVEQVQGLLGQVFDPFPDDTEFVPFDNPDNQLAAVDLAFSLFGVTDGGNNTFGEGFADDTLGLTPFGGVCQPFYNKKIDTGESRVGSFCLNAFVTPDDTEATAGFGFGIWAYRDVAAIPIPAVAFLFPAGLIAGLGWMRRISSTA